MSFVQVQPVPDSSRVLLTARFQRLEPALAPPSPDRARQAHQEDTEVRRQFMLRCHKYRGLFPP